MKTTRYIILSLLLIPCFISTGIAAPTTPTPPSTENPLASMKSPKAEEMDVLIKGQFKGRLMVKKITAPVTMNLEKLQEFPEDPSQKILLDPLPISQSAEVNARAEVKGHAPFVPWIPAIPEPPFLRMLPPTVDPKGPKIESWMFEVLNPQGQTIYRQRGTNSLPDELIWEGKDSEKQFAVVDRLYSAQLTVLSSDGKANTYSGNSIVLPSMMYGSAESLSVEYSLDRLFKQDREEISAEGLVMMAKLCERVREMGLLKMHLRISGGVPALSASREKVLASALTKALILPDGAIETDHAPATERGNIAVFWLKTGGSR